MSWGTSIIIRRHLKDWHSPRYNFFLDEVINIKNTIRTEDLTRQGFQPRLLEKHELESRRSQPGQ